MVTENEAEETSSVLKQKRLKQNECSLMILRTVPSCATRDEQKEWVGI
jgi:hypothetical protein